MPNASDFGFSIAGQLPGTDQPAPFNPDAHAHLIALGYERTFHACDFHDDGDGESGPHLAGGPAWDEYTSADDWLAISDEGRFEHWEPRDHEREAYEAAMADDDGDAIGRMMGRNY